MVTFVTLFLSIVAGPQNVEMAVGPEVARVELLLDGQQIASMTAPPWKRTYDFGKLLTPRKLEAIALDAEGEVLHRTFQLLNVPQPRAGATLVVKGQGKSRIARLTWKTVEGQAPEEIVVELDGEAVTFTDPRSIQLPPLDDSSLHFLTAAVTFPGDLQARAWSTFGGSYGGHSEAELTSIPVFLRDPEATLPLSAIENRVLVNGEKTRVVAVERTPAELLMVRSPAAGDPLRWLGRGGNTQDQEIVESDPMPNMPNMLHRRDRFNILATWTGEKPAAKDSAALFPMLIADRRLLVQGVPTILTRGFAPVPERARHRIADAVAAAGRSVAANGRSRAVILVLSTKEKDWSAYSPNEVRPYLAQLGVPLTVWTVRERKGQKPNQAWGKAVDISSTNQLRAALRQLRVNLDRQRILWLEGRHLPQSVTLAPDAPAGVEIAR